MTTQKGNLLKSNNLHPSYLHFGEYIYAYDHISLFKVLTIVHTFIPCMKIY